MNIFYFRFSCIPINNSENYENYAGGYVNCWIRSNNEDSAQRIAEGVISKQEWEVEHLEEKFIIEKGYYGQNDEGAKYYEQALLDSECCVFHTWER
ncbi:MAG: hypothetical protein DRQ01_03555 [Ignavibacteriae bacterium]|nr:MAG: hypothetical protein DRQ01_03555 [Ignavibacteriota bacterium]